MNQRLTWDEIESKYPDQWVGLTDVEWQDAANVRSAVVSYTDKEMDKNDIFMKQASGEGVYSVYTTPDNLAPLGIWG